MSEEKPKRLSVIEAKRALFENATPTTLQQSPSPKKAGVKKFGEKKPDEQANEKKEGGVAAEKKEAAANGLSPASEAPKPKEDKTEDSVKEKPKDNEQVSEEAEKEKEKEREAEKKKDEKAEKDPNSNEKVENHVKSPPDSNATAHVDKDSGKGEQQQNLDGKSEKKAGNSSNEKEKEKEKEDSANQKQERKESEAKKDKDETPKQDPKPSDSKKEKPSDSAGTASKPESKTSEGKKEKENDSAGSGSKHERKTSDAKKEKENDIPGTTSKHTRRTSDAKSQKDDDIPGTSSKHTRKASDARKEKDNEVALSLSSRESSGSATNGRSSQKKSSKPKKGSSKDKPDEDKREDPLQPQKKAAKHPSIPRKKRKEKRDSGIFSAKPAKIPLPSKEQAPEESLNGKLNDSKAEKENNETKSLEGNIKKETLTIAVETTISETKEIVKEVEKESDKKPHVNEAEKPNEKEKEKEKEKENAKENERKEPEKESANISKEKESAHVAKENESASVAKEKEPISISKEKEIELKKTTSNNKLAADIAVTGISTLNSTSVFDGKDSPLKPCVLVAEEELKSLPVNDHPALTSPRVSTSNHKRKKKKGKDRKSKSKGKPKDKDKGTSSQSSSSLVVEKKIGIGVIGLGARSSVLLDLLLQNHGQFCTLAAVSDEVQNALNYGKDRLGCYGEVEIVKDYKKLVKRNDIEWVIVCSKTNQHRDHVISALKSGKNVFCETPLATTIEHCEEIRQVHLKSGKLLLIGSSLRYSPVFTQIKTLLKTDTIGKIVSLDAIELGGYHQGGHIMRSWRRHKKEAGPIMLSKGVDMLDIIAFLIQSLPSKVISFGDCDVFTQENKPGNANDASLYKSLPSQEDVDPFTSSKDINDNQVALIEYRNKSRVSFHVNINSAHSQRKLVICGLKGTIECDVMAGNVKCKTIGQNAKEENFEFGAQGINGGGDEKMVNELVQCMRGQGEIRVTPEDAFVSVVTSLVIDKSSSSNSLINVDSTYWKKYNL